MQSHTLTVPDMKLVVLRLAEAMKFLHERDLVHGCLDTNLVSLDIVDGVSVHCNFKSIYTRVLDRL
jgi:hypothetical protein